MSKSKNRTPTEAEHRATMTNLCLASISRLARAFNGAGHYDFEKRVEELEADFRGKLKGMGYGERRD